MQIDLTAAEAAALAKLLHWSEQGGWIYASRPKQQAWDAIRRKLIAEKEAGE